MRRYTFRAILFSFILILLGVAAGGCSFILPLTEIQPLEEKLLEGSGKDKILLIDISGIISDKKKALAFGIRERPGLVARVKEEIDKAEQDDSVRGIILRINSPGGTVTASDIIYHEIRDFKQRTGRVVVVEMLDVAASGGYYIAAAADTIIAHPTTVTGSIGVVAYRLNAAGLIKKLGLMDETIKSGRYKDIGSPLRNMSEGERKILQGVVDSMYTRFLDAILGGGMI